MEIEVALLESSRWGPGMLLNILQHTAQHPISKNYLAQNVNSTKVEEPWLTI